MARTAEEIQADIDDVRTAISNMLKTGKKYKIGSGPSSRETEFTDIASLREYMADLQSELDDVNGTSGILVGF